MLNKENIYIYHPLTCISIFMMKYLPYNCISIFILWCTVSMDLKRVHFHDVPLNMIIDIAEKEKGIKDYLKKCI